jgi:IS30 family transposase
VAVATGISPRELLELDADMFDALAGAVDERWSPELELAALQTELAHAQLLSYLRVHSKRGTTLPKPLRIPRPHERAAGERPLTIREFAAATGIPVRSPARRPDGR